MSQNTQENDLFSESSLDSEPLSNASFEDLLESAKKSLAMLNSADITLKDSMQFYKDGMNALSAAQELLESAKLEYEKFQG